LHRDFDGEIQVTHFRLREAISQCAQYLALLPLPRLCGMFHVEREFMRACDVCGIRTRNEYDATPMSEPKGETDE